MNLWLIFLQWFCILDQALNRENMTSGSPSSSCNINLSFIFLFHIKSYRDKYFKSKVLREESKRKSGKKQINISIFTAFKCLSNYSFKGMIRKLLYFHVTKKHLLRRCFSIFAILSTKYGRGGIRTHDLILKRDLLYQLSYTPISEITILIKIASAIILVFLKISSEFH